MPRAIGDHREIAQRPTETTSGAASPLGASPLAIVAELEGCDLDGLRRRWRAHLAGEAPAHLPRWLLVRLLAYRLQADASGDLNKSIRRMLRAGRDDDGGALFDKRAAQTREGFGLKAGALLVREWHGKLERVMVLEEGFAWNGRTFRSLSQIAKAITGTTWNGHRFFGLRQGKVATRQGATKPAATSAPTARSTTTPASAPVDVRAQARAPSEDSPP